MSEWEDELRRLRGDLGPTASMQMRWRRTSVRSGGATSGFELLTGIGEGDGLTLALYPMDARRGDRPMVEVEVKPDPCIASVEQPTIVRVAGIAKAGHAVVVVVDDHEFWPVYPCNLSMRPPRL